VTVPLATAITLIGPGAAGKSTTGAVLADRLGIAFVDLDTRFADRNGDISEYITQFGYDTYVRANIDTYRSWLHERTDSCVIALSSGFMAYPRDSHPDYRRLRRGVEQSLLTFALIPSLSLERCVAETVRRQLARPFTRSAAKEEAVIRERCPVYVGLCNPKIETMRPLTVVVDEILAVIRSRYDVVK
jgi:shikimate kinase